MQKGAADAVQERRLECEICPVLLKPPNDPLLVVAPDAFQVGPLHASLLREEPEASASPPFNIRGSVSERVLTCRGYVRYRTD